jgi:hypothetical protein
MCGERNGQLIDAVLVQPRAAGLVELFNMVEIPRGQEREQRWEVKDFFVVNLLQSRVEFSKQMLVCGPMVVDAGEALLQQELFFTLKVHLGEVDEAFELQADVVAVGSAKQHDAQVIQRIHEDAVLIVDGFDADDALVTPRQKRHIPLREQGQV